MNNPALRGPAPRPCVPLVTTLVTSRHSVIYIYQFCIVNSTLIIITSPIAEVAVCKLLYLRWEHRDFVWNNLICNGPPEITVVDTNVESSRLLYKYIRQYSFQRVCVCVWCHTVAWNNLLPGLELLCVSQCYENKNELPDVVKLVKKNGCRTVSHEFSTT